jgi:hypothetical protein
LRGTPGLTQRVFWSNFRRIGFCNSSDFSSLGVGVDDFIDYFVNVRDPFVRMPTASEHFGGFFFCLIDLVEYCFPNRKFPQIKLILKKKP